MLREYALGRVSHAETYFLVDKGVGSRFTGCHGLVLRVYALGRVSHAETYFLACVFTRLALFVSPMLWSQYFISTVKETPHDATAPSHVLMIRAGLIRQVAAGSYTYLPLGYRVIQKITNIIREEMNAAGAIELNMPAMHPVELWDETGRVEAMGDTLIHLPDRPWRKGTVLGPTHEEVITDVARAYLNSYKQLPINLYQIQTKFRDEQRPKSGVLRTREFLMKDAYSFDTDKAGLDASYDKMYAAYCRIFERCGMPYIAVEAESGAIGGDASHEFMVVTDAGEDWLVRAEDGSYAANVERAEYQVVATPASDAPADAPAIENIATPKCPGIQEVCERLSIEPSQMIKTLVFEVVRDGKKQKRSFAIACVRGDHEVNEAKLRNAIKEGDDGKAGFTLKLADAAEAERHGFAIGYVGPHAVTRELHDSGMAKLYIDHDALQVAGAVTGNNTADHHCKHFYWTRDVDSEAFGAAATCQLRYAVDGDNAPNGSRLIFEKCIEVGHVFKLGTKYSDAMKATFLDKNGKAQSFIMGCYGMGVNRVLAAAIEAFHDESGICWPANIAPFSVHICALDVRDDEVMAMARRLHDDLEAAGIETLLDDRDLRPGHKFKDADLIGIPMRVTVGKRGLSDGIVEFKLRTEDDARKLKPDELCDAVRSATGDIALPAN